MYRYYICITLYMSGLPLSLAYSTLHYLLPFMFLKGSLGVL